METFDGEVFKNSVREIAVLGNGDIEFTLWAAARRYGRACMIEEIMV